jgi:hypothetical protein
LRGRAKSEIIQLFEFNVLRHQFLERAPMSVSNRSGTRDIDTERPLHFYSGDMGRQVFAHHFCTTGRDAPFERRG